MSDLLAELAAQLRYAAEELDKAEQAAGRELFIALDLAQITEMARIIEEALDAAEETSITNLDCGLN